MGIVRRLRNEAAPPVYCQPVPLSYKPTATNAAGVLLVGELLADAGLLREGDLVRKLFGDSAYRSEALGEELAGGGVVLATEKAHRRPPMCQQVEVCFAALKGVFRMGRWPRHWWGSSRGSRRR